jgi:hypothetical protein
MLLRKPPRYAWALTPAGERAAQENLASNDTRPCPNCGCTTLR